MTSWILLLSWLLLLFVSTTTSQVCPAYSAFLVVDGSSSIKQANFDKIKSSLKDFVNESISRNKEVRIGIIVYSDDIRTVIDATSNTSSLFDQIDDIKYPKGGTGTSIGIRRAQKLLELEPTGNPRVMIVVSDGASLQPEKTKSAAAEAKRANITMISVGINEVLKQFQSLTDLYDRFRQELSTIADRDDLFIELDVFGHFTTQVLDAIDLVYPNITSDASCQQEAEPGTAEPLSPKQIEDLDKAYNFTGGEFGPFIFGQIWRSEEVHPCTGEAQVNAYVLLLNDGICGRWAEWQEDRFYHSHEGKAVIDKFHPNGTRVSECLGSTAKDPNCMYVVKIPKGWIANIRTIGKLAIFTSVIINGNNKGGQNYPLNYMYEKFGEEHRHIIDQTVICYKQ